MKKYLRPIILLTLIIYITYISIVDDWKSFVYSTLFIFSVCFPFIYELINENKYVIKKKNKSNGYIITFPISIASIIIIKYFNTPFNLLLELEFSLPFVNLILIGSLVYYFMKHSFELKVKSISKCVIMESQNITTGILNKLSNNVSKDETYVKIYLQSIYYLFSQIDGVSPKFWDCLFDFIFEYLKQQDEIKKFKTNVSKSDYRWVYKDALDSYNQNNPLEEFSNISIFTKQIARINFQDFNLELLKEQISNTTYSVEGLKAALNR